MKNSVSETQTLAGETIVSPRPALETKCVCEHRHEQHAPWDYGAYCHVCECRKYLLERRKGERRVKGIGQ